jgi:hypothetical protein
MAKRGHKKTKRAAEVSAAVVILLGLGAGVVGVMLYNHNKQATTTPTPPALPPPNAPIAPGLTFNRNPPAGPLPPPGIIGTADQHLR